MNEKIFLLLVLAILHTCLGDEDNFQYIIRGQSTNLTCPIDTKKCGELHSIKWFKGIERIGVVSGDGQIRQVEDSYSNRFSIEFMNRFALLSIKSVEIDDEDVYLCEVTYMDPLDECDSTGEYRNDLKVAVPPSTVQITYGGEMMKNGTTIGPTKIGQKFEATCEVHEARPKPLVGWYRKGVKLSSHESFSTEDELFTVKSKLMLDVSRQDLGSPIECRVKTTKDRPIITNQINIDLMVKPTRIVLDGVESHTVQGSRVSLECRVFGAKPAANITWYNSTNLFDVSSLVSFNTKTIPQKDGTFETTSNMFFVASRFENQAVIKCEAENIVMIEEMDKPLMKTLDLEVLYPPVVTISPHELTINETEDILLFCQYKSNPNSLLSVRWFRDNHAIDLNQSRIEGGTVEQPALLLKNARRDDIGNYSCELTNQVGNGISENSVYVDVQYKPTVAMRFEPPSPIIERQRANVTLHCDVIEGNPRKLLRVQWIIDGMVLTELPECNDEIFDEMNQNDDEDDDDDNIKSQNYFCFIDPTKILLQNVNREFLGNYSCRGYNAAGMGEVGEQQLLDVYYEPGNATISVSPTIPIKGQLMNLSCSVDDLGNPKSTRFHWFRGNEFVKDIVTSQWTIDPVGLHSRNNYSCFAVNSGGNGSIATINTDIHVAPWMIRNLPQYTGFLYSEPNVNLSCRAECVPSCSISWFRDGQEILANDEKYFIKHTHLPADTSTGDFESIFSELIFNISAWPGRKLDIVKDSANYSCISSNNSVGMGSKTSTSFKVEYPPENVTIYPQEQNIIEGQKPSTLTCVSSAHPAPTVTWKHLDSNETLTTFKSSSTAKYIFPVGLTRTDKGAYACIVENKHGQSLANITINILYAPNCTIYHNEEEDDDTLLCVAEGNPQDFTYEWDYKAENDTEEKDLNFITKGKKSYLTLGDVASKRVYYCRANNSVGAGSFCEITIEGHLLWYQKLLPLTPFILVALLVLCLVAVVILICIIICICRRRRKRSSKSMEKSLMDCKPLGNAEPCENYENLPFHGMQNPPTKSLKASDFGDDFDGIYADVEDETYGPIHYKQASIYQFLKFKKN